MAPEPQQSTRSAADIVRERLRAEMTTPPAVLLTLPIQVITKADVSRLNRETQGLMAFFAQAAIKGATAQTVPQLSAQLTALLNENKLNMLKENDRLAVSEFLSQLLVHAPIVHASFAVDPKPDFLMRITAWFRKEAHPNVLLQLGLRPSIAAGCVFRTTNKYFDFSFKKHFEDNKSALGASLRGTP